MLIIKIFPIYFHSLKATGQSNRPLNKTHEIKSQDRPRWSKHIPDNLPEKFSIVQCLMRYQETFRCPIAYLYVCVPKICNYNVQNLIAALLTTPLQFFDKVISLKKLG
jgi:hypothetical protein